MAEITSQKPNQTGSDLGGGEGKNAAAFARAGASVTCIDCSDIAISNGKAAFPDLGISWCVGDAEEILSERTKYDVVVMYGLLHCMPSEAAISNLVHRAIGATKPGGMHILVSFNDRSQDLALAHPGFHPTLLPHLAYMRLYSGHDILCATDSILEEVHPHNGIPHHHSVTRMVVEIR
ncbi:class I SAM-dependent methyltransferase [Azospirillum sp. SYSU D00513]|uniref:class I SAM-dependent methyltransferase n=1 Tax=Azospirillum sp. SYSU D00513 TaxID=2812561 RepID=UPI001A9747F5|nr:class I SAM-dependent methyltransferase [Azospirillum sp. SYSU D00513]